MLNSPRLYQYLLGIRPSQLGSLIKQLLRIKRQVITDKAGRKFLVDPVSVFGLHLITSGIHEAQLTHFVEKILRSDSLTIDIGGNEGYFSIIAAQKSDTGRIICVEPQQRLQMIITKNAQLNDINSIELQRVALSDTEGVINLYLRPSTNTGASSFFPHWRFGRKFETVPMTTLDFLVQRLAITKIRLLKCDCEGAEYLVVKGAQNSLASHTIDYLVMEYHPSICGEERCTATHTLLLSLGYTLTKVHGLNVYHLPGLAGELCVFSDVYSNVDWR